MSPKVHLQILSWKVWRKWENVILHCGSIFSTSKNFLEHSAILQKYVNTLHSCMELEDLSDGQKCNSAFRDRVQMVKYIFLLQNEILGMKKCAYNCNSSLYLPAILKLIEKSSQKLSFRSEWGKRSWPAQNIAIPGNFPWSLWNDFNWSRSSFFCNLCISSIKL